MKNFLLKIYVYLLIIISPLKLKTKIFIDEDLINYIMKNKLSLIRFGDGEYRIMYSKKSIHYQDYSELLRNELLAIFKNYSVNSKYMICIPSFFKNNCLWFIKNHSKYAMCFAKPRLVFRKKQNSKLEYGDSFIFGKNKEEIYNKIWKNKNKIILIHNNEKWVNQFNKKYKKNAIFIKCSKTNSYKQINNIEQRVLNIRDVKDYLILISSGPMAKILAYRLSNKGIQAIDVGHCFDDPLE